MQSKKIKLFVIGFIIIAIAILGIFVFKKTDNRNTIVTPVIYLSKIYDTSNVEEKGDHYQIDSKIVYVKTIKIGADDILVVAEKQEYGGYYRLYKLSDEHLLLKEVETFLPLDSSEEVFTKNFFEKDVTGDGLNELFVRMQVSGNNLAWYEILQWKNNDFMNLNLAEEKTNLVGFDEINYEEPYATMTWHANDAIGKTRYRLENNTFIPVESVGFFQVPIYGERCEVRTRGAEGEFKVVTKEKCDDLGQNFGPYFTN